MAGQTFYVVGRTYIFTGNAEIRGFFSSKSKAAEALFRFLEKTCGEGVEIFAGTVQQMMDKHATEGFNDRRALLLDDGTCAVVGRVAYDIEDREMDQEIEL